MATLAELQKAFYKNGKLKASVLSKRACDVCGARKSKVLFVKDQFRFVKCACGFVYVNPMLSVKALKKFYTESEDEYWDSQASEGSRDLLERKFDTELRLLEKHVDKGAVLDIGCGAGVFLHFAKKRGWKVYGTEFNKFCRAHVKKMGINISDGDLSRFKKSQFQLVTLHQVFEHLPEPNAMLKDVHRILENGGVLFISVPYIYGITTLLMGRRGPHYDGVGHLNYFSKRTLKKILAKHGFDVVRFRTEGLKLEWLLAKGRKMTGKRKAEPISRKTGVSFKIKVYYLLSWFFNLFGRCDYITVTARKRAR